MRRERGIQMSTAAVRISQTHVSSRPAELSLFRLYTLRVAYLIIAGGLGVFIWPSVVRHTNNFAIAHGGEAAMLAGICLVASLGPRYPLPLLHLLQF